MGETRTERARTGEREVHGRPLCEECGRPIPIKRLRANPFATRCYACQDREEHPNRAVTAHDRCPICGHGLMWKPIRTRFRFGYRLVCTRYPDCRYRVVAAAS